MSLKEIKISQALVIAFICALVSACASAPKELSEGPRAPILELSNGNFSQIVLDPESVVLVLFNDDSQSSSTLSKQYYKNASEQLDLIVFARFDASDKSQVSSYGVTRTPAVALYANGFLIDQVAGEPASYSELVDLENDFNLWVQNMALTHALKVKNKVSYRFNNTTKMTIATH